MGAPILGDTLYCPLDGLTLDFAGLSEEQATAHEAALDAALAAAEAPRKVMTKALILGSFH